MAVTTISSGVNQEKGISYTVITDTDADWSSVSADTYFYDLETDLPYYKSSDGSVSCIMKGISTDVSPASLTVNTTLYDIAEITALGNALTINVPTGLGNKFIIRIKDDGTARAITFNGAYRAIGVTLPTTTTAGKLLYLGIVTNFGDSKWDVVAVKEEA